MDQARESSSSYRLPVPSQSEFLLPKQAQVMCNVSEDVHDFEKLFKDFKPLLHASSTALQREAVKLSKESTLVCSVALKLIKRLGRSRYATTPIFQIDTRTHR